jgi:hypothetical protein
MHLDGYGKAITVEERFVPTAIRKPITPSQVITVIFTK